MTRRQSCLASILIVAAASVAIAPAASAADDKALCQTSASNPDAGIPACTRLIDLGARGGDLSSLYTNRGSAWYRKAQFDNAIADFSQAIQRNPSNVAAYHNRGLSWHHKGQFDSAVADFSEVIRLDPNSPSGYTDRGAALISKGEFDSAIADFDRAIKINGQSAAAYQNRGLARHAKGELDPALEDFDAVIKLAPRSVGARNNRAALLIDKGDFDGAIKDYDEAIRLEPQNWRPYSSRGEALRLKGNLNRALEDHNAAIKLNARSADAYNNRALIWRDKGDLDKAVADYSEAVLIDPRYARAYGNRGEIWRLKGDLNRSLADLNKAIELSPKDPMLLTMRGETLRYRGQFDLAMNDFDEAIRISPDGAIVYTNRAQTLEKMGDISRARLDFEKALSLPSTKDPATTHAAQETARARLAAIDAKANAEKQKELAVINTQTVDAQGDKTRLAEVEAERANLRALAMEAERKRIVAESAADADRKRLAALEAETAKLAAERARLTAEAENARLAALEEKRTRELKAKLPSQGHRVALVIGNSDYKNVSQLGNPRRDAETIAATLRKVGFQQVVLKTDLGRYDLYDSLRDFANLAERADWAMVYYAGHGMEVDGVNYLIPVDAKILVDRDVKFEAIALDQVLTSVETAKKLHLVVLDACRDNPFAAKMKRTYATRSMTRGLATVEPQGGMLVVYAAKAGQFAMDGSGNNSPFVTAFSQRMSEPGIEINKVFRLVRDDVLEATSGQQEPFIYGSLPGREDFYFATEINAATAAQTPAQTRN